VTVAGLLALAIGVLGSGPGSCVLTGAALAGNGDASLRNFTLKCPVTAGDHFAISHCILTGCRAPGTHRSGVSPLRVLRAFTRVLEQILRQVHAKPRRPKFMNPPPVRAAFEECLAPDSQALRHARQIPALLN